MSDLYYNPPKLTRFPVLRQNAQGKQLKKKKGLFWFMISEVSMWALGPGAFKVAQRKLPEAELKAETALAVVGTRVWWWWGINEGIMSKFGWTTDF